MFGMNLNRARGGKVLLHPFTFPFDPWEACAAGMTTLSFPAGNSLTDLVRESAKALEIDSEPRASPDA